MKQCNLGKKQNISKINFCKAPIGMLLQIKNTIIRKNTP